MFNLIFPSWFNKALYLRVILFCLLVELISFWAWLYPVFNLAVFGVVVILVFVLALKQLNWAFYIAAAELIIASQGYLFSFQLGTTLVSLRIGIFIAIMSAWLIQLFYQSGWRNYQQQVKAFKFLKPYLWLALVLSWGFLWSVWRDNNFGYLFLDFNNWLFFLYFLPLINLYNYKNFWPQLNVVILAALSWLVVKTFIFLYIFSHQFIWALPELYHWIRDTHIGEITLLSNNFYRIFLQSQFYALIAFLILLPNYLNKPLNNFYRQASYWFSSLLLAVILISFSRSFWLGLLAALIFYFGRLFFGLSLDNWRRRFHLLFKVNLKLLSLIILSLILILFLVNAPPYLDRENLGSLLTRRSTQIEAAGSSRLNMLKPLAQAIVRHPLLGSGSGTTVTYRSLDPRVLTTTAGASGEYTTYAFEWSYLDLWLKVGLLGMIVYLGLIFKIAQFLWLHFRASQLTLGLFLSLLAFLVLNIFTPYLNHPLGIGYILWLSFYNSRSDLALN